MSKEFHQVAWDAALEADWLRLLELAVQEDLGGAGDWTTQALVPPGATGRAAVVVRGGGVVAGLPAVPSALEKFDPRLRWSPQTEDGRLVERGGRLGVVEGPARGMLAAERVLLNLLSRLSGIASLTRKFVDAAAGTKARIYDTRKTTPGWRRLEKYAVRCGGGWNHRTGLFEAVLIKDNHLALAAQVSAAAGARCGPAAAVAAARRFVAEHAADTAAMIIEVEVDTLGQLDEVLAAGPDLVLLDNMQPGELRQAVARRDALAPAVELEASGGIDLAGVRRVAESGVERISVGALTHSAAALDIGLDWLSAGPRGGV
jgi:nicotinate-nucleotide pyrophosphorylase (carboxylating)